MNWEPVRSRLLGTDLDDALAAAKELREGIEIVHTVEFPLMLSALLPAFSTILATNPTNHPSAKKPTNASTPIRTAAAAAGAPSATKQEPPKSAETTSRLDETAPSPTKIDIELQQQQQQKQHHRHYQLRNTILEIISRMPSNEVLRPHAPHLVAVALDVLIHRRDYEENALLASRIIFDLYKAYRSLPQDYIQPALDFVVSAYKTLPGAVSTRTILCLRLLHYIG
jgi:transformation/transcription domain-associated protein